MSHPSENPGAESSFLEKGGGWVVAQFVVMAAWLAWGPMAGAVTGSVWLKALAGFLIAGGAVFGLCGVRALGGNRTPYPKPLAGARLVEHGIYEVVRHPLYTSLIALSFGWACLWASGVGAGLAVVQALLLDAKARREERWLRALFPGYEAYAHRVRRLVPWRMTRRE